MVIAKKTPVKLTLTGGDVIGFIAECKHEGVFSFEHEYYAKAHEDMCNGGWFCKSFNENEFDEHWTHKNKEAVEQCNARFEKDEAWKKVLYHLQDKITCPNGHQAEMFVEPLKGDEYECYDQEPYVDIEFKCSNYYDDRSCPYNLMRIEYDGYEELYLGSRINE